jgi:hypothetical protein
MKQRKPLGVCNVCRAVGTISAPVAACVRCQHSFHPSTCSLGDDNRGTSKCKTCGGIKFAKSFHCVPTQHETIAPYACIGDTGSRWCQTAVVRCCPVCAFYPPKIHKQRGRRKCIRCCELRSSALVQGASCLVCQPTWQPRTIIRTMCDYLGPMSIQHGLRFAMGRSTEPGVRDIAMRVALVGQNGDVDGALPILSKKTRAHIDEYLVACRSDLQFRIHGSVGCIKTKKTHFPRHNVTLVMGARVSGARVIHLIPSDVGGCVGAFQVIRQT